MKLHRIHEHTFDIEPLGQPGARVLDVGCLDFALTRKFLKMGCSVCGLEPNPTVQDIPIHERFKFIRKALVARTNAWKQKALLQVPDDPYAAYVNTGSNPIQTPCKTSYEVELIDIVALTKELGNTQWTAVKLDCEGSEYEILLDWPGPIARQISVEFHDHVHRLDLSKMYASILERLSQWYTVRQFKRTGNVNYRNYWDVLFILHEFAKE